MSESAEALSANQSSRRNVTIEITNYARDFCLIDPKVYLESGNCHSPPQPTVRPLKTEVCNFSKGSGKSSGSVGVLTYDLFERGRHKAFERFVIMFSVPYDYNLYENWVAIGIFDVGKEVDKNLYEYMYYKKDACFKREKANGCGLIYQGNKVDIMCTMSPMGRAIMKLEVWDKTFS
ncbi:conoporin-Cn1-like [Antennarius striatus]|uniref:conoporin-Cn1-like n=1 Tax=Antennarius striatus TaxID=241820 RepID=UPI0035B18676